MNICNDSVYFSIATNVDFREKYEVAFEIINKIVDFFHSYTDIPLMFNYLDDKTFRINKPTEKNKEKLYIKLKEKKIFQFMIAEYVTIKEYYDCSENQRITSTISCTIDFLHYGTEPFGVSVSIPTQYMTDQYSMEAFYKLFKDLNCELNGFNSFISRGSCFPTFSTESLSTFDSAHFSHKTTWSNCVRGYYWGNVLNNEIIEKVGGIESIEKQGFYKVEKWQENIYIQVIKNLFEYSLDDAVKIRNLLLPAFPALKNKMAMYESVEGYQRSKKMNIEYFMVKEDLI